MAGMPVAKGKNREQDGGPLLDMPGITLCFERTYIIWSTYIRFMSRNLSIALLYQI
jgi:hypothetical protein